MTEISKNIGDEFDDIVWASLLNAINKMGGKMQKSSWGHAGSQELSTKIFEIAGYTITIEEETYMGMIIRGDKNIVEQICKYIEKSS